MMIRINLLPTRQVKRRGQGTQVLTLLAAALVLVLAGNYYWYTQRQAVTDELATRIAALQAQIEEKKRVQGVTREGRGAAVKDDEVEITDLMEALKASIAGKYGVPARCVISARLPPQSTPSTRRAS